MSQRTSRTSIATGLPTLGEAAEIAPVIAVEIVEDAAAEVVEAAVDVAADAEDATEAAVVAVDTMGADMVAEGTELYHSRI